MNKMMRYSVISVLCCFFVGPITAYGTPSETIKLKSKDPQKGRFEAYKSNKFYFKPEKGKKIIRRFADVESIEITPPVKVIIRPRGKKKRHDLKLKSFSTDRLRRAKFVFMKGDEELVLSLKDVISVEATIDFSREMAGFGTMSATPEGDPNADVNIQDLIKIGVVTIVHFHMSTAIASVRQGTYVASLQDKHKGKVEVVKVDVAGWESKVAKKYDLRSAPQFWFYDKNGKLSQKLTARFTTDDIDGALAAASGGTIKKSRRRR